MGKSENEALGGEEIGIDLHGGIERTENGLQRDEATLGTAWAHLNCDAPKSGGPLTTRQPAEYSWMSGYPTPLTKIGQSLLCTGSST